MTGPTGAGPTHRVGTGLLLSFRVLLPVAGTNRVCSAHGPGPPEGVHERGSQGDKGSTEAVGELNSALAGAVVVVDVGIGVV